MMQPSNSADERVKTLYHRIIGLADNPGTWDRIQGLVEAGRNDEEIIRAVLRERAAGHGI